MTVVSDASPLHYLVLIKAEHVLAEAPAHAQGTILAKRLIGAHSLGSRSFVHLGRVLEHSRDANASLGACVVVDSGLGNGVPARMREST
jgi:hypothetical protein